MNIKIVSLLLLALLIGNAYCELEAERQLLEETVNQLEARHPGHDNTNTNTNTNTNNSNNKNSNSKNKNKKPTQAPTRRPATQAPTRRPATQAPTTRPATQAPTTRPATQAPTTRPATQAPTTRPATQAPTTRPATQAPTTRPSTPAPSTGNLCTVPSTLAEPVKILVPLYVYPGSQWDQLITAANSGVDIIAIINPNSGPGSKIDSAYTTYIKKMLAAGIELVGYVHTTYGDRSISDVQKDINSYASWYPGLTGIFIDEASASSGDLSYYTQVYQAITAKSGYTHVILNPGTQPDQGYLSISSNIVIFESPGSGFTKINFASWVKCASSAAQKSGYTYRFGAIAYATSASAMPALLTAMRNAGIGLVYATDGAAGGSTYNNLVSYMAAQAAAVKALN